MRVLGIDYGSKRIGIAVCDETGSLVRGLDTLDNTQDNRPLDKIKAYVQSLQPEEIVVGYPFRQNGCRGSLADAVDRFIEELKSNIALPVTTVDESFTSESAAGLMRKRGIKMRKRRQHQDRIAACQILQSYLNEKEPK